MLCKYRSTQRSDDVQRAEPHLRIEDLGRKISMTVDNGEDGIHNWCDTPVPMYAKHHGCPQAS